MDGALGTRLLIGPARCLAIDRDHTGRYADEARYPGDKAALERLGIERGEDIAEMIVGRSGPMYFTRLRMASSWVWSVSWRRPAAR